MGCFSLLNMYMITYTSLPEEIFFSLCRGEVSSFFSPSLRTCPPLPNTVLSLAIKCVISAEIKHIFSFINVLTQVKIKWHTKLIQSQKLSLCEVKIEMKSKALVINCQINLTWCLKNMKNLLFSPFQ